MLLLYRSGLGEQLSSLRVLKSSVLTVSGILDCEAGVVVEKQVHNFRLTFTGCFDKQWRGTGRGRRVEVETLTQQGTQLQQIALLHRL